MLKLRPPDRRKGAQKGGRKGIEINKNFVKLFWYEMSSYRPIIICFNYYCQLYTKLAYWLIDWKTRKKGKKGWKEKGKKGKREREKKGKIQESGEGNGE